MKKTIYKVASVLVICLFIGQVSAQTTDVKILDLSVSLQYKNDTVVSDSVELLVNFKINKANKGVKVYFFLGTAKDSSNILVAEPVFSTTGATTNIIYNNISNEVKNYNSIFLVKTTKAIYESFVAATLFVETIDGPMTSRLYFVK